LAGFLLSWIFTQLALEHSRMRCVDDHQLFEIVGMSDRKRPCDGAAPVMRHQDELLVTKFFSQRTKVFDKVLDLILIDLGRLRRKV